MNRSRYTRGITSYGPFMLFGAGVLILSLVVFRYRQLSDWEERPPPIAQTPRMMSPAFELADQHRHVVKLGGFLGRERVVLVFFDDKSGADQDFRLKTLLDCKQSLKTTLFKIVAVSSATRFANLEAEKRLGEAFPFPLLTDISPERDHHAHRLWGRFDDQSYLTKTGLFLIERNGTVLLGEDGFPLPETDEAAALATLCRGEWPGRDS